MGEIFWPLLAFFYIFGPFFGPFLGIVVKSLKKVLPGIVLNFCNYSKNPSVNILVLKMYFPKIYIFEAPIESTGPGMVSSYFVKSPSFVRLQATAWA